MTLPGAGMRHVGWTRRAPDPDAKEIDEMTDALVDTLATFARAGYHGQNAISACVAVLCAVAKEGGPATKFRELTEVIEVLREQAEEWRVQDGLPPFKQPGIGA